MSGPFKLTSVAMRIRLLPTFIAVAGIVLLLRTGELASDVAHLLSAPAASAAQSATPAQHQDETGPGTSQKSPDISAGDAPPAISFGGVSEAERTLLEDLRARRRQLEEREQQTALREQILASTERRIDQKINDLRAIEENVRKLVAEHQERENEQLKSIVKVYETMKPKDAAPIFQKLDMSIQEAVATRMKDAKMAALLAEMTPDAATELTTRLARGTALPHVEEALAGPDAP